MTAASLALALAGLIAGINLLCLVVAFRRLTRHRPASALALERPPVSIVRPVRGLETFSRETLTSGLVLEHPDYETLFCVADADDPILPLIDEIMARHPQALARVIVGDVPLSANPKLNNCVKGWREAAHDWVILADSNVLMPQDYIGRMLAAWRGDTGLVCSTPAGSRPDGFWSEVECAFLNSLQARWQYAGEALGFGFAQGKSMLWHKPFLDARGGIEALAAEIAEDAAATKLIRRAGKRVHLVGQPFEQPLGLRRLAEIVSRQYRWARLRRVTFLPFYLPEIFANPLIPTVLAFAGASAAGLGAWSAAGLVLATWYAGEIALALAVGWFVNWRYPVALLARDLLFPAIWARSFLAGEVEWRGNAMRIKPEGEGAG